MIIFRKSIKNDVEYMVEIADQAKALLKSKGIQQWQRGTYPDAAVFLNDIETGIGYVVEEDGEVVAICALTLSDETDYRNLISGKWMTEDDAKYVTVHRSSVARTHQGRHLSTFLFDEAVRLGQENGAASVRVDTHPDNKTMQGALERAGFQRCGEFYLSRGDEAGDLRYGYEKLI